MYSKENIKFARVVLPKLHEDILFKVLEEFVWAFDGMETQEIQSIIPCMSRKEVKVQDSVCLMFYTTLTMDNANVTLHTCIDRVLEILPKPTTVTYSDFNNDGWIRQEIM